MNGFLQLVFGLSKWANHAAGATLTAVMLITVGDVLLRSLGSPIVGIYELVAFAGAVVIGFSIPFTSWVRGHIYVDFFVGKLPGGCRKIIHLLTRSLGIGVFGLAGWNLMKMAQDLRHSGEVSPTLHLPFYPVVYGIGLACLLESLVLVSDMVKVFRDQYE
jgi:TRAP-type C4-dicarboxylate transport system permease small subunit